MPSILKFSDGTTTVDFVATTSGYSVTNWNPAVARRRTSLLAGRGPYEDVAEQMEITINGSDPLGKLATLQYLFDQAARWASGDPVDAVLLHYQATSTSPEMKATVLGPDGNRPFIQLPGNFPDAPVYAYIDPVRLNFRRLGLWLGESVTATSSGAEHPTALTMNLTTSVDVESPIVLKLASAARSDAGVVDSFILMQSGATTTEAASRLLIVEPELFAATGFSTSADSTNKARGGVVLRYTPPNASELDTNTISVVTSADQDARRWGAFISYRNNSTTTSYNVRLRMDNVYTPVLRIPEGTNDPTWAYLGAVSRTIPLQTIELFIQASQGVGTIDFDAIALLAMDSESTGRAVAIVQNDVATTLVSPQQPAYIDHQLLTKPQPAVWVDIGFDPTQGYRGDATLMMRGSAVVAAWLATRDATSTYWRITDTAGTVINSAFTATRLEGRLTPE